VLHVAEQGVEGPIVHRDRPVLLDGRICRHMQAIILAAIKGVAVFVPDVEQVVLACAEIFDADEGVSVGQAARIDRVGVGVGKSRLHGFDQFGRDRHGPVRALIESRKARVETLLQKGSGFLCRLVEYCFGFRIGIEGACPSRCRSI
jgi:hypothetical protein